MISVLLIVHNSHSNITVFHISNYSCFTFQYYSNFKNSSYIHKLCTIHGQVIKVSSDRRILKFLSLSQPYIAAKDTLEVIMGCWNCIAVTIAEKSFSPLNPAGQVTKIRSF